MKRWLIGIGVTCVAIGVQAQTQRHTDARQETLAGLDACVGRLDSALDTGYARVAARCPHLTRDLERSGWVIWLPRDWKDPHNDLSAEGLKELRTLLVRELDPPSLNRAPSVKRLNEVLAGLGPLTRERESLWSRFRAWLRRVTQPTRLSDRGSWLDEAIRRGSRSQILVKVLTYTSFAVLIVLLGVIIASELRASGLLKSRLRAPKHRSLAAPAEAQHRIAWADVERAAPADRLRLLLELIVVQLVEQRRIAPAGALTVRELVRAVELKSDDQRARLNEIVCVAEQARYARVRPAPAAIEQTVARGRQWLEHLDAPA